jgi:phosphoglycolate phosphatase
MIRAVLCDLDGTLLDTAPDLAAAVNRMLDELGHPRRSLEQVTNDIGRGTRKLVERSLPAGAELEQALRVFGRHYEEESGLSAVPFAGVVEGLRQLSNLGLRMACVTNKPRAFTVPLLERTGVAEWFAATVCGDDVPRLKPDPAPYAEACRRLGVAAGEAVAIGDSSNDVVSARAAGCTVLCVPYGYREGEPVASLEADALVNDFRDAAEWIRMRNSMTQGADA